MRPPDGDVSSRKLDKQYWSSEEIITMESIYLKIHSIETVVAVRRINKVNMEKYTDLERKEPREEC